MEKESIKDFSIRLYNENLSHEERAAKAREAEMERSMAGNNTTVTGQDVFGNPVDPRVKSVDPLPTNNATERYSRVGNTPTLPTPTVESEEDIIARKTQSAQAEIDAINRVYQNKIAEQRNFNKGQERQTASINTLTGLAGSTEANRTTTLTQDHGKKQIQAIQDEQAVMIAGILSDIREDAAEEARLQVQDARTAAQDSIKQREAAATKAVERVAVMSAAGVTAEGLKTTEPEVYASLVDLLGGENALQSYITLNRPKDTLEDKGVIDGKYYAAYRNPITQELRVETVDLGVPEGYTESIDLGDKLMFIPDNFDPLVDQPFYVNKGLSPDQIADNLRADIKLASDLAERERKNADDEEAEGPSDYSVERAKRTIQSVDELLATAQGNKGIFGRTAAAPIPDFMRSDDFRNFENELQTLKSNIAFNELTAMREASKTGGALGQVSDREGRLLESALGALSMSQSADNFIEQLNKIKTSITNWQNAVAESQGAASHTTGGTLTSPDGTQFVNVADLTPEELKEAKEAGWQ